MFRSVRALPHIEIERESDPARVSLFTVNSSEHCCSGERCSCRVRDLGHPAMSDRCPDCSENGPRRLITAVLCEPFAGIAFGDVCLVSELCAGHRAGAVHCLVKTKAYADPHQRHTYRRAEIDQHLPEELLKFLVIDHETSPSSQSLNASLHQLASLKAAAATPSSVMKERRFMSTSPG